MTYEELFIARGGAEKAREIALNMYSLGISKELISKYTKLSLSEIDKLIGDNTQSPTEPHAYN